MIGFYVHHHGTGHLRRTLAILEHLAGPTTILTSLDLDPRDLPEGTSLVRLPPDHDEAAPASATNDLGVLDPTGNGALHWVPLDPHRLKPRAQSMVEWLTHPESSLLVSDVSVEAVVLARLCGVAPVAVFQNGRRDDPAHRLADSLAVGRLCPYPEAFENQTVPEAVRERTHYTGLLSAPPPVVDIDAVRRGLGVAPDRRLLVVLVGGGGSDLDPATVRRAADRLDDWEVRIVGPFPADGRHSVGWVDDARPIVAAADVVIAAAGSNAVAEVAAAGRPLVAVAEARPFDEQAARVEGLVAADAAVGLARWPAPDEWVGAVERAHAIGGERLRRLWNGDGARDAARWLADLSDRYAVAKRPPAEDVHRLRSEALPC